MAANGAYGIGVAANVTSDDIEIFYNYHEERSSDSTDGATFHKLSSSMLLPAVRSTEDENTDTSLPGMYNLKLPLSVFGQRGFYSVYIRPKEVHCTITDVGVLSAYSDVRGIILNYEGVNDGAMQTMMQTDNGLCGYRVEFLSEGTRLDYYRIITSSFKVEPIVQNLSNSNQKSIRYRYNASSNLVFLTLTPSTAPSFKPNSLPFIGNAGQEIIISNTKFSPIMLDIEMTEHDIETLTTMIEGDQLRNLENGLMTVYNQDGEIYKQFNFFSLKETTNGTPIYEARANNESIDFSESHTIIEDNN